MVVRNVYRRTFKFHNNPGEAHYLTFSCFKKRHFLSRDRTRQYVIDALERSRARYGFDLWAFVIMSNHVHLLIYPPGDNDDMGKIEVAIKLSVSRRAMNYLRRHNPEGLRVLETGQQDTPYRFWQQGNGYDENVASPEAIFEIIRYIHENPVRAGLCEEPADWQWSSAREWRKQGSGPLRLDRDHWIESGFNKWQCRTARSRFGWAVGPGEAGSCVGFEVLR